MLCSNAEPSWYAAPCHCNAVQVFSPHDPRGPSSACLYFPLQPILTTLMPARVSATGQPHCIPPCTVPHVTAAALSRRTSHGGGPKEMGIEVRDHSSGSVRVCGGSNLKCVATAAVWCVVGSDKLWKAIVGAKLADSDDGLVAAAASTETKAADTDAASGTTAANTVTDAAVRAAASGPFTLADTSEAPLCVGAGGVTCRRSDHLCDWASTVMCPPQGAAGAGATTRNKKKRRGPAMARAVGAKRTRMAAAQVPPSSSGSGSNHGSSASVGAVRGEGRNAGAAAGAGTGAGAGAVHAEVAWVGSSTALPARVRRVLTQWLREPSGFDEHWSQFQVGAAAKAAACMCSAVRIIV